MTLSLVNLGVLLRLQLPTEEVGSMPMESKTVFLPTDVSIEYLQHVQAGQ